MSKLSVSLTVIAFLGCSAVGSVYAQSTGPTAGQMVRVVTGSEWQFETDVVVKSFMLFDVPPILGWENPDGTIGYEGPFVGGADVLFSGQDGVKHEKAINSLGHNLWSSAVLEPGTKLHLVAASFAGLPNCSYVTPPETCIYGIYIVRTATILNR